MASQRLKALALTKMLGLREGVAELSSPDLRFFLTRGVLVEHLKVTLQGECRKCRRPVKARKHWRGNLDRGQEGSDPNDLSSHLRGVRGHRASKHKAGEGAFKNPGLAKSGGRRCQKS